MSHNIEARDVLVFHGLIASMRIRRDDNTTEIKDNGWFLLSEALRHYDSRGRHIQVEKHGLFLFQSVLELRLCALSDAIESIRCCSANVLECTRIGLVRKEFNCGVLERMSKTKLSYQFCR
jgi:hypothetical protein